LFADGASGNEDVRASFAILRRNWDDWVSPARIYIVAEPVTARVPVNWPIGSFRADSSSGVK
jgi:hypothetical protein